MRVGIVCEGVHDFPALSTLIADLAAQAGRGDVSCSPLQPRGDASSKSGDGGWAKVAAWCLANSGAGLDSYLRAPLFAGEEVYDAIVIHLDGDIASECATKYNKGLPNKPSVVEIVKLLSELIHDWVKANSDSKEKIKIAIPVQKTESWILAALSRNNHAWEEIESKSVLLSETGFVEGRGGKAKHYRRLAAGMTGSSKLIEQRSESFKMFAVQFS